jgi:hypothetical protein
LYRNKKAYVRAKANMAFYGTVAPLFGPVKSWIHGLNNPGEPRNCCGWLEMNLLDQCLTERVIPGLVSIQKAI